MLIQFKVKNFLSFKDITEFSMIAGRERIHPDHVIRIGGRGKLNLQRLSAIYGANASGKSNFVKALNFLKELVCQGRGLGKPMRRNCFRLDPKSLKENTLFEIDIRKGNVNYNYGLEINDECIVREWLNIISGKDLKRVFSRECLENGKEISFGEFYNRLGKEDQLNLKFVAKGTRSNQPFIYETVERNLDFFDPVYFWFRNDLNIVFPDSSYSLLQIQLKEDERLKKFIGNFLSSSKTGIDGIVEKKSSLREVFPSDENIVNMLSEKLKGNEISLVEAPNGSRLVLMRNPKGELDAFVLKTVHKTKFGNIEFDLSDESDGTKRLLDLMPTLFHLSQSEGAVFVIDELSRSLHPSLATAFIQSFLNFCSDSKSQMIFTTHQVHLMNLKLFRRGELWYSEKDESGNTELFSLLEFKRETRYDKDIEKAYFEGRMGGIALFPEEGILGTF